MNNIDRITNIDFVPTEDDVLNARSRTSAITETSFRVSSQSMQLTYRVFDVGGQRVDRKKWAPYFEDVTTILYLVAISAYDLFCMEDETSNQSEDTLLKYVENMY